MYWLFYILVENNMTWTLREFHVAYDIFVSTFGIVTNLAVIILTSLLKNKTLKMFKGMILVNAVLDLFYAANTLTNFCTSTFAPNAVYIIFDNPYYPRSERSAYIAVCTQLFLLFFSISILPLQFVYRYGILRGNPFTTKQTALFGLASFMLPFIHAVVSPFTFSPPSEKFDRVLREAWEIPVDEDVPLYVVGDVSKFDGMSLHFLNLYLIVAVCYGAITYVLTLTKRTWKYKAHSTLTEATRNVQQQFTKVIYFQAFYPLLTVFIPCLMYPTAAVSGKRIKYIGELVFIIIHSTPAFNSMTVLVVLPGYRRYFERCVKKKTLAVISSTNTR